MLRLEGRGDFITQAICHGSYGCSLPAEFRCEDCFGTELYCQPCTLEKHREHPLHRIKHWKDEFFHAVTLKSLGLRIQLGHPTQERCYNPAACQDFIVLHVNGVHEVALDFCGCETAQSPTTQLLRIRWFPATVLEPKTAATFKLLRHFHILSFESKVSTFEYWQTLTRLTHNRGVVVVKDRYDALLRMIREWRNITLLKRFGRGHDPAGTGATEQGSCAVLCPACPQPGKNLPENWESAPPETRWLYALFLAIDANFRLARKNVSSDQMDPGLNRGWAYFVEERQYKTFLTDVGRCPQEKSTCASHNAVNLAETKNSRGLAATGAGTVDCSRHNFKRPCGVGDLQKGEKYVNMDYLFFSTMQYTGDIAVLNISYDIACQWSTNLWQRMHRYPSTIHLRHHDNKTITFLVPKFHLPAHIDICQITYSHNLLKGMGRTDGEAPERGWANINPVATSTREMGPGSRRDTLDDHFGDFNWKKVTNMGVSLSRKLKAAVPERDQHVRDFEDFDNALQHERPEQVAEWRLAVEKWESDSSQENPFALTGKPLTQAAVRLSLSQQEADNLEHGMDDSLHEEVSRSVLISSGMEIEDQQCRLARDIELLGGHPTDLQRTKLQERSNILRRKIEQWSKVQLLYMPVVARLRASDIPTSRTHSTEEKVHEIELWLPSKIYGDAADPVHQCDATLCQYEWELRRAQAYDALDELRRHLRLRAHLYKFKDAHIRGQRANTRASAIIDKVESNVSVAAARYRRAWSALEHLSFALSRTTWKEEFPKLENDDIRGMSQGKPGQSSGNRTLSWIWKARYVFFYYFTIADTELLLALRIEWCKSRARATRWVEEVQLLREEMRRVAAYLLWHAAWWDAQADRRTGLALAEVEGIRGYAKRQAAVRRDLHDTFLSKWGAVNGIF
ncbi:uncharacterized protein HD556DRAFT_1434199 [Suillus plorans]|uniref:CxC2-like cysteine cluster KDZ transposase-associated domain-containing protein n=1 Tax=Suillus plorans TaxID=116603 RepID=A0A9P7AFZ4_9AGAM|nr:uncharacterized protein HD556DRAFT_1434199 [Suillus plorans]KAG1788040.1 hypothetical protein HD556DRAFT_1434199 [Suillus plorans]